MTDWRRLHPLSPLIRAGRALIAIVVLAVPATARGHGLLDTLVQVGIVALLAALGFVHWLVTRWRVEDDDLRIETGVLRRSSVRYPLQQLQAIDLVRPGLARVFGLAELRLRMAGATGAHARLAYLREDEAEELRARLLELARREPEAQVDEPAARERVLHVVPTPRLVGSILLADAGIGVELVALGLVVAAVLDPSVLGPLLGSAFAIVVGVAGAFWRRFNDEYRLTVSEAPDGLRLHAGLVALTSETIPRGRVQAVRMKEPLLWRPFGWCRLEVDVAGHQRAEGEGSAQRRSLRVVLPVGSRTLARGLLERILPDAPEATAPPPRRVRLKSPLRFHFLRWGRNDRCVATTSGRIARVTDWVPLEKAQSLRVAQGPVQRLLRVATVHLDTAGRSVHAALRDRDVAEVERALPELVELARASRRTA